VYSGTTSSEIDGGTDLLKTTPEAQKKKYFELVFGIEVISCWSFRNG
jgi:hypothetical protein